MYSIRKQRRGTVVLGVLDALDDDLVAVIVADPDHAVIADGCAQNRLAELRAAGQEALCINGFDNSGSIVHKMEYDPRHMDESAKNTDFYYLLVNGTSDKSQTAATALLPSSAVDQELWNGYWCIEFAPETGSIYAVFYSEATLPDHDDLNTR